MTDEIISDVIMWDVKSWARALTYWDEKVDWSGVHKCLELGGREGGLSLWLALKGKHTICSDLSGTSKTAAPLHEKYKVGSFIDYQDIDATKIPYEDHFDVIVFKSILGGIGRNNNFQNQQKVINEAYKALKKGGTLLFAENLVASPLHRQLRKRFVNWGDSWRYVTLKEMQELLNKFTTFDIHATGVIATFGRNEWQRNLLASVDKILLNHICPDNWKYITFGMAVK